MTRYVLQRQLEDGTWRDVQPPREYMTEAQIDLAIAEREERLCRSLVGVPAREHRVRVTGSSEAA